LLRRSLEGITSHAAKSDILTPWKETERRRREVYVADGVPDPAVRKGMFHRVLNPARPELNSRDGIAQARRGDSRRGGIGGTLATFMDEQHDDA
jgi:hypothetical protein